MTVDQATVAVAIAQPEEQTPMPTIAELQTQLAAAEDAELAALGLDMLRERIETVDRRADKLARQLGEVRGERLALAADRDERIRRGARAGLTASRLAEAAGLTRSRAAQIIAEEPEEAAAAADGDGIHHAA